MKEEKKEELAENYDCMCKGYQCGECPYDFEDKKTELSLCELLYGYETGVKDFAKFLIDKGISNFEMPDLVKEFLEKGE